MTSRVTYHTALAAADTNAVDVSTPAADPSAQDFYLHEWGASGPGGAGTDAEREHPRRRRRGIQTSRISTAAENKRATSSPAWPKCSTAPDRRGRADQRRHLRRPGAAPGRRTAGAAAAARRLPAGEAAAQRRLELECLAGRPCDTDMTGSAVATFCAPAWGRGPRPGQALNLSDSLQERVSWRLHRVAAVVVFV